MSDDVARRVFDVVDSFDPDAFAKLFADDGTLRFGNAAPSQGPEAIAAGLHGFFSTLAGLSHRIVRSWEAGADVVAETEVTYDRLDGTQVTVVAVSIWTTGDDGLITDYRVFVDLAPLYETAGSVVTTEV